jgi:predicted negative regulator of RcsB-dependent stress response
MPTTRARPAPSFSEDPTDAFLIWVRTNGRTATAAVIIVAGVAGAAFLYRSASTTRAAQAEAALLGPRQSILAGNIPLAQTDLKRVLTRFKGTAAATEAAMLLATTYYDQHKYTDGVAVLEQAQTTGPGKPFASATIALIADGYAQEGKYREAAANYERAASATSYRTERDRLRAAAARAYVAAPDTTAAIRIWTELSSDPKSPEAGEAHLRLGELTAKPIGKAS